MTIIFSYNRPDLLTKVVEQCPEKPVIIDDGSSFDPMPIAKKSYFHRLRHKGKEQFFLNWQYAFKICAESTDDFFLFLPDDFLNVDYKTIEQIHTNAKGKYIYNLLNDGRPQCWTPIKKKETTVAGVDSYRVSYCDGGYFTNRETLEAIHFEQEFISFRRFDREDISSGVGETQSRRFWKLGIPMYCPKKSLCFHGEHDSVMHYELRKKEPLKSL
jgi:hypothetical protein